MKKNYVFFEALVIVMLMLGSVSAQLVVRDYNFSTPGSVEGWSDVKSLTGTFGQATASSGEGVLQTRMKLSGTVTDVDMQLLANPGVAKLPIGSTWESIDFRIRQLNDSGSGAPGTPQTFSYDSTILLLGPYDGATRNLGGFAGSYWSSSVQDADGWKVFSFDFGQYIADNGLNHTNITHVRLDPIGNQINYGKWIQLDYFRLNASVPRPTEPIYKEYTFESMGDVEGWSAAFIQSNSFDQATAAEGGEGVLQVRQNTNGIEDVQLQANPGALSIKSGQSWDTFEFRIRQLQDNGSDSPGIAQSFNAGGTILYLSGYDGAARHLGSIGDSVYWWRQPADADGWAVFTFDFAQYIADNGLSPNADITQIRLDPVGDNTNTAGVWAQIDYFNITATPAPPATGTIILIM